LRVAKHTRRAKAPPAAKPVRRKTAVGRAPAVAADDVEDDRLELSGLSLHDLFQRQVRSVLDRTDLDEEHKQSILIAASCPCCGAGSMSFAAKIKRRS